MQGKDLHIRDSGVSNRMIPPIMNYFCACPPITVSLCEFALQLPSLADTTFPLIKQTISGNNFQATDRECWHFLVTALVAPTSCHQQALCWRWNTSDCWLQCIHYTIIDLNLRRFKDLFLFQIFLFKVLHEHWQWQHHATDWTTKFRKTFGFLKY